MLRRNLSKMKKILATVTVCTLLGGMTSTIMFKPQEVSAEESSTLRSVMYYGNWSVWGGQGNFNPADIPAQNLTHLNLAFLDVETDGSLKSTDLGAEFEAGAGIAGAWWGRENAGIVNGFKDIKLNNPNLKIGISLGGWTKSGDFSELASNPESRANLIENVMKYIEYNEMDFVDIDWEYPASVREADKVDNAGDEGTPNSKPEDKENFVILLEEFRAALNEQGERLGKNYELSIAIPVNKGVIDNGLDVERIFQIVDFANIMTYDMTGGYNEYSGHHTGLYTNPNDQYASEGLSVDAAVNYYLEKGAVANKIVIGSAFYSRGWGEVEKGSDSQLPGLFQQAAICGEDANGDLSRGAINEAPLTNGDGGRLGGIWAYRSFDALKAEFPGIQEYWDDVAKAPYMYDEATGAFFTYDNVQSITEKANYVKANNLGGMIAWMASNDNPTTEGSTVRDELTNAMKVGLFGQNSLPIYCNENFKTLNLSESIEKTNDGFQITITNNEVLSETDPVLAASERASKSLKLPVIYIKATEELELAEEIEGTMELKDGYYVITSGMIIPAGESITFKFNSTNCDVEELILSQRISSDGVEHATQSLIEREEDEVVPEEEKKDPPKTGDVAPIIALVALMSCSGGAMYFNRKRKS